MNFLKTSCPLCTTTTSISSFCSTKSKVFGIRDFLRCHTCYLTFLEPSQRLAPGDEKERYNLHVNHPSDVNYRKFLNKLVSPCAKRVLASRATPVLTPEAEKEHSNKSQPWGLDFGCGPGPTVSVMMKEQHGLDMVDWDLYFQPQPELPKEFPTRLIPLATHLGPGLHVLEDYQAQVLQVHYDYITSTEVIEHISQPAQVFKLFDKLLLPPLAPGSDSGGGLLALMTGVLRHDADFSDWHYHRDPTHICFYRPETWEWIAEEFNWALETPHRDVAFFTKQ